MAEQYKLIDPFVGPPPKEPNKSQDPNIARWFRNSKALMEGATIEQMVADMDESQIEAAIMTATGQPELPTGPYSVGQRIDDERFNAACKEVADIIKRYPKRFYGCAAIDPTGMMKAVRQVERALPRIWIPLDLDDARAGRPAAQPRLLLSDLRQMHGTRDGGQNQLRGSGSAAPGRAATSTAAGRGALAFPELTVVGAHVGHPWHLETVALLQKFPNFYMITSGFAPKHVPQELWQFANSRGAHKVLWSSDYPILPMQRCATEGHAVPLKDEVKRRYLRDNAIEVFKLDR